jgi:hypothetical protein
MHPRYFQNMGTVGDTHPKGWTVGLPIFNKVRYDAKHETAFTPDQKPEATRKTGIPDRGIAEHLRRTGQSIRDDVKPYVGGSIQGDEALREIQFTFRATIQWLDLSKNLNLKKNQNEPAKLDKPSSRELEGAQPDDVQGAESQRQTGDGTTQRGGADTQGDVGLGGNGVHDPRSMGNDAGEVFVSSSRRSRR